MDKHVKLLQIIVTPEERAMLLELKAETGAPFAEIMRRALREKYTRSGGSTHGSDDLARERNGEWRGQRERGDSTGS